MNSQQYSTIYEDWRPKIEDIERSDGETIKPGALKRPELDPVRPINVSSRPVSTEIKEMAPLNPIGILP